MQKRILTIIIFVVVLSNIAKSQVSGNLTPMEGSIETYTLTGSSFPSGVYTVTVTNGTLMSSNFNPANGGLFVQIRWNFSVSTGQIKFFRNGVLWYTLNLTIVSLSSQNFCQTASPGTQDVTYGVSGSIITITNCNLTNYSWYTIQYQWESGDFTDPNIPPSWASVIHANLNYLNPPAMLNYGVTGYRRIMYFYDQAGVNLLRTYTSDISYTRLLGPFIPGSIIDANSDPNNLTAPLLVALFTNPQISQTPASGGLCFDYGYQYTWERSIENKPWEVIGTGVNYPSSSPLIKRNCRIRRKVECAGITLYSNILTYQINYVSINTENLNYVREITILKREVDSWAEADYLPVGDKLQKTTYLDGLGRAIQVVDREICPSANNTWKDLVTHIEYDAAGRQLKDYIPYASSDNLTKFKTTAITAQPPYIQGLFNEPANAPTYSLIETDNSPLNRIMKSMMPGASWAGNNVGTSSDYDFNNSNNTAEKVHSWELAYSLTAIPVTTAIQTYSAGQLSKTVSFDENGKKLITYTDLSGNLILKKVQDANTGSGLTIEHSGWACTYYAYDDLGHLRYIITPKAVDYLDTHNWVLTQDICDELCYKYLYDERGRSVVKKQPGSAEVSMVYDKKNRLVLTQHANQLSANNTALTNNQWSFILYDDLNRTIATGLLDNNNDRATIQGYVNGLTNSVVSVSAFVGNSTYQNISVDNPVAGSSGSSGYVSGTVSNSIVFNSVTHFDNYDYTGVKSFQSNNTFAYSSSDPNIESTATTTRVMGAVTGEKIRVLDGDNNYLNDKFLFSTAYYDESGRTLQNIVDNVKNATDYQSNQYYFDDKLMSTFTSHSNGTTTYTIISKNEFDKIGRLTKFSKNFNNTSFKQLSECSYDELGQLKTKRLAPGYTGTGQTEIESQTFSYNIQGWLTGINKDWANSNNNYTQWDHFFGLYLGYDNRDNSFATSQLSGNITGVIWRSQGDNNPRKFDYEYDNLDRFKNALFKQKTKPSDATWSNAEVDFSTYVQYNDGNGNLHSMKHMGVIPGINNGIPIDDLLYSYLPVPNTSGLKGNKLQQVDDNGTLGSNNGKLGDFNDGNTSTQDYWYDVNGNLVKDLNKNIKNGSTNGVIYNYMNKPEKIIIENKSTIEFTYNASGEKLSKKVTPAGGAATTTYYVGDFVYQTNTPVGGSETALDLQFVLHEEGRLKIITPHTLVNAIDYDLNNGSAGISWPGGKQGVFEYFIKDNLGSTRMVLTEEYQKERYTASMELSLAPTEDQLFGKVNSGPPVTIPPENELEATRLPFSGTTPWPGNNTDIVKLTAVPSGSNSQIKGPNLILKVMAGDVINAKTDYYYLNNNSQGQSSSNPLSDILTSLLWALQGKTTELGKNQATAINTVLSNNLPFQNFVNPQAAPPTSTVDAPKAYLNIVFLDEQFKFVEADLVTPDVGSGYLRVSQNNTPSAFLLMQKKAPKNGWVFIYLSNESNEPVYFDNLVVNQTHSAIAEENHYYPFGLKIAGITSHAFNKLDSKYDYQGEFSEEESETSWDEFYLRMYDAQIGRWIQPDPFDVFASPYSGMGNNPINEVDPSGGDPDAWLRNKNTGQWEWFDKVNSWGDYISDPDLVKNYDFDFDKAFGGFIADFAGTPHYFYADGTIEPLKALSEVLVFGFILPPAPNKLESGAEVEALAKKRAAIEEKIEFFKRDWQNGQVAPPYKKPLYAYIFGSDPRTLKSLTGLDSYTTMDGEKYMGVNLVDNNGYLTHRIYIKPLAGTIDIGMKNPSGFLRLSRGMLKFEGDEAIIHFGRHSGSIMKAYGTDSYNLKNYIQDANLIIKEGTYVPELNAYAKRILGPGSEKYGFVGLKNAGSNISTFHIKSAKQLVKKAPSLFK